MAPLVLQLSFDIPLFSIIRTEHNFLGDVICSLESTAEKSVLKNGLCSQLHYCVSIMQAKKNVGTCSPWWIVYLKQASGHSTRKPTAERRSEISGFHLEDVNNDVMYMHTCSRVH